MTDLNREIRERDLNEALEALYLAHRAVIEKSDRILAALGLSRVHHRILYVIGRNPNLSVGDLLTILRTSKQSLNAPLRDLLIRELVRAMADERDRRIKRLSLTPAGAKLEKRLSGNQRQRFARVFAEVGANKEMAWRHVMRLLAVD